MRTELLGLPSCEPDGRHWFWHGEHILRLLDRFQPKVCVELGSFKGGSAIATARAIRKWGGHLTAIDVWEWVNHDQGITMAECARNIHQAGVSDQVTLIQSDTKDAARAWTGGLIDYLYVDADHTTEACLLDLELWWPHVRVGGLIAGDDYGDPRWGATAAWDRFEHEHQQQFERLVTPGSDYDSMRLICGVKR